MTAGLVLLATALYAQGENAQVDRPFQNASEAQLLGTWVAVRRSVGGLGSMWTFLPGGKREMSIGAIVEGWYKLEGDSLIQPPGSTLPDAKPTVARFRVEGDTLYLRPVHGRGEVRMLRAGKAAPGDQPIVGVWRSLVEATAASVMEEQRKAGRQVDEQAARSMAEVVNRSYQEYTRDGLAKLRVPMRTTPGTYDASSGTFSLGAEGVPGAPASLNGKYRLESGLLILTLADGKTEETYVRADATKEELKRAGVRYGDKPAELGPPS